MNEQNLESFGFKFGISGAHSARSMMIEELTELFALYPKGASLGQIKDDVVTFNCLHKPTENSRKLTYRHLTDLYSLDTRVCLFRNLMRLWANANEVTRPILAFQLAYCRDPLLRASALPLMIDYRPGDTITREQTEALIESHNPGAYSAASLKSFAQNINGSLTQAGFMQGRNKKTRSRAEVGAVNVAFALFIAYLNGKEGSLAMNSPWLMMLGQPLDELIALAQSAHSRSLIKFTCASDVMEVRFPDWLTNTEKDILNG